MPNITLAVPKDLWLSMQKHSQIRWSEVARRAIDSEIQKLELLNRLTEKSKLTMEDVREIDAKIKEGIYRHFKS